MRERTDMIEVTCAILAAGASTRMGRDKATLTVERTTLLARALEACAAYPTLVVVPSRLLGLIPAHVFALENDAPERGMAYSARLANARADAAAALLVVLVDMPFVDAALIRRCAEAPAADIAYPLVEGRPGHPVRFGPRARAQMDALPDGDTLRILRDDATLSRATFALADASSQRDLDTPDDVRRFFG